MGTNSTKSQARCMRLIDWRIVFGRLGETLKYTSKTSHQFKFSQPSALIRVKTIGEIEAIGKSKLTEEEILKIMELG